jgi:NAD(P)-dependent dehydrogenase (short-subunit alcohol dehydrogenase family)
MEVRDKVVVITGGGSGIGAAMARRFAADGAEAIVVADLHADAAAAVAGELGGVGVAEALDVCDENAVRDVVERTVGRHGRIDLFCSNAGITTGVELDDPPPPATPSSAGGPPHSLWQKAFEVHVLAHVYAARAVVPHMLQRGGGYLLNTASAAGLLVAPGDGPYTVSKHGAVGFAEWLSVTYGSRGIGVSVLCPLGVATPLLMDPPPQAGGPPRVRDHPAAQAVAASGEIVTAEHVADTVVAGLAQERFLILPHPEVGTFWAQKASDPDRWLAGVRRLIARQG